MYRRAARWRSDQIKDRINVKRGAYKKVVSNQDAG